jgi:hypothetical protein|tara:strand:- start:854 stop:2179 length:1326 start_codon:yes stop_codon:yes gene_type:complete
MTLLHIEGFDVIDSTAKSTLTGIDMSHQAKQTLGSSSTYTADPGSLTAFDVTGRYTGSTCLQLNHEQHTARVDNEDGSTSYTGNTGTWSRIPFAEQQALGSFTFGFAFKTSAINSTHETTIASIADNNGNPLLLLSYNTSGYLKAYLFNNSNATYARTFRAGLASIPSSDSVSNNGNHKQKNFVQDEYVNAGGSTTDHSPLGTGSTALVADTWYTIECQIVENSSKNYSLELRLDDVVQVDSDSNAVSNNTCANLHEVIFLNAFLLDHSDNSAQTTEHNHFFDDFYFLDDAGSNNTDFLGSGMRVQGLPLGSAGTAFTQNFSVTSGTIAGNLGDFDTSTVATLANPGSGIFDVSDPETVKTGNGIRYIATAKYATGATNLEFFTRTNSANHPASGAIHDGSAIALTSSFNTYQEIQELNPATSANYNEAELDAIQIGLRAS